MSTFQPRKATTIMQDAEKALELAKLQIGSTLLAEKKQPGTIDVGNGQRVVTNVYLLEMSKTKDLFRYEVNVSGVKQREFDLTTRSSSDYRNALRRLQCYSVLRAFKIKHASVLSKERLYYDCGSILISTFDLKVPVLGAEELFTLEQIKQHSPHFFNGFDSFKLKILPVHDTKKLLKLTDFSYVTNDAANIDRTTQQFLDIATSQDVFEDPFFGFTDQDCPVFPSNSSFLGIGMHKGIRTVEHASSKSQMSEAIVASTPFHFVELVSDKLLKLLGPNFASRMKDTEWVKERVEGFLKGLFVVTNHTEKSRVFEIHGLSTTNLYTEFIQREGGPKVSLFEYYTQTYHIDFKYPNLPLIVNKYKSVQNADAIRYFPMEVCVIQDNQRVTTHQLDPQATREMIRKTAIPPAELKKQNALLKNSLQLDGSEYLNGLGVKCQKDPIEIVSRVLPPPELEFASKAKQVPKLPRCSWSDANKYFSTATCNKWVALALFGAQQDAINMEQWTEFVKRFRSVLAKNRMQFAEPQILVRQATGADLKLLIQGYYEQ
uniref:PAZ domain-containing protein n=1 Tax=Meloidogyne javanica TaxID=6303 RepID=A0A915MEB3_MELJA